MARKSLIVPLVLAALLVGCADDSGTRRYFDGPESAAALMPTDGGPFDWTIGFVANTRSSTIVPVDLKRATLLSDQAGGPFLTPLGIATGDQRQLGEIAVWAADETSVDVFAVDLGFDMLVQAPYIVGVSDTGEPITVVPQIDPPVFIDADDSGDAPTLGTVEMRPGFTTTEYWSVAFDGELWWVEGSRSGPQTTQAIPGEAFTTDNRELTFTIEGDATEGDRFELFTDTGLVEHDLGGVPLGIGRIPYADELLVAVWDAAIEQGTVVHWDAAAGAELGRWTFPEGAQPWRFTFHDDGHTAWVADAQLSAVYELALDEPDPSALTPTEIPTEGPITALAWVADPGDQWVDEPAYEHLFIAPAFTNSVEVYDLRDESWIDVNPYDDRFGGLDILSPVVGLSASADRVRLFETSTAGARKDGRVVTVTTHDGGLRMFEADTGCLAIDMQGPRVPLNQSEEEIEWDDRGGESTPVLYQDTATGRRIIPSQCGGVVRGEVWTLSYDGVEGNWRVEGTISGLQTTRAWEDERYVSDDGALSFLILSGSLATTDGDSFQFDIEDGVLRIDEVLRPDGSSSDPIELPGPPLVFQVEAGAQGGGWDADRTQIHALVPVTNSDIVLRVRLEGWSVEVVWD